MIQEVSRFSRPLEILLLEGGVSAERDVSIQSGVSVREALLRRGHRVSTVRVCDRRVREVDGFDGDVAFVALHGRFGEDGGIQTLLEGRGIPYTGSRPAASRLAMDKVAAKEAFRIAGIPTPDGVVVPPSAGTDEAMRLVEAGPGLPAVAKPIRSGSSIGVEMIRSRDELFEAMRGDRREALLVEEMVRGREMTVSILGEEALPVVELRPAREFFDYVAKYGEAGTEYGNAASLSPSLYRDVQQVALAAHRAIGCRGFSRVDVFLSRGRSPSVLEVNSIPGITDHSLLPKAARMTGRDLGDLCEEMIAASAPELGALICRRRR